MTFIILCIRLKKDKVSLNDCDLLCLLTFQDKIHYCLDALIDYLHYSTIFLFHLWFYLHLFICVSILIQNYQWLILIFVCINIYMYLYIKCTYSFFSFLQCWSSSPALKPVTSTQAHLQKFLFDVQVLHPALILVWFIILLYKLKKANCLFLW